MSATINTFPPFQSMNSPRGWILAVIVLLHLGFFALLSSSMGIRIVEVLRPPPQYVDVPDTRTDPEPEPKPTPVNITGGIVDPLPPPVAPLWPTDPPVTPTTTSAWTVPVTVPTDRGGGTEPPPVILAPEVDPRIGLSEPAYPASEIRLEHEGTVLLSVHVLANGRVGDVRLDQSSGWPKLDDSALREARRWRFKPGMQNGVAAPMWKQVPITFQLQGRSR
jgi:periplasmic protein TonB